MNWPWKNRTGLAKAIAIFSTVLLLSLGLCGANFLAVSAAPRADQLWLATGVFELLGIVLSALGLLIVGVIWIFKIIRDHFSKSDGD